MKVETAVGELAVEYEGRVRFNIVSAEETAKRGDEIELYGFTEQLHGLVALDPSGAPVATPDTCSGRTRSRKRSRRRSS